MPSDLLGSPGKILVILGTDLGFCEPGARPATPPLTSPLSGPGAPGLDRPLGPWGQERGPAAPGGGTCLAKEARTFAAGD